MALARSIVYWYFPIYSPTDLTSATVELSMTQADADWHVGDHEDPPAEVLSTYTATGANLPAWAAALDPQWIRFLTGPEEDIALSYGKNIVHGRLTDSPETPYFKWVVNVLKD